MSTSTYTLTCVDCGREFIKTTKSTIGFEEQFQCPTCVCDHGSSQAKLTLIDEMATPTLVVRWAIKKVLKVLLWIVIAVVLVVGYYGALILTGLALSYLVVPLLVIWLVIWFVIIAFVVVGMLRKKKSK